MRTLGHPLIGEYKARLQLSKGIFDLLWFGEDPCAPNRGQAPRPHNRKASWTRPDDPHHLSQKVGMNEVGLVFAGVRI